MAAADITAREGEALVAAYALLRDIARRHVEQAAALAEAERVPKAQRDDDELPQAA